ncbi:MAG: serine/threonine-protein kinase [Polyangiaceae bacterium]
MDSSHPTALGPDDTGTFSNALDTKQPSKRPKGAHVARGTVIDRYTILDHLGSGGMASVYSAYDTQLERIVALKMLRAELTVEEIRARMLREAQAMARLKHQHVVTVYEVGTFDNRIYIAMEFVDGTTLSKWSKERRPWRELLRVLKAAGRGLAAAHEAGLVHRDFKPDNVLVGNDGRVLVSDFGIALSQQTVGDATRRPESERDIAETDAQSEERTRPRSGTARSTDAASKHDDSESSQPSYGSSRSSTDRLTEEGAVLGTPGFIAPEHLLQGIDDARSDQFSFCVSMYRVLYGTRPYEFRDIPTYCTAVQKPPIPPPDDTPVPRWVHAIILRGLQQDPTRRFASMTELLDALERDPWVRRSRWALGACVAALAIGAAGVYGRHRAEVRAKSLEGEALMASTWNAPTEENVRASLLRGDPKRGSDVARIVVGKLNEYARNWTETHRSISEATLLRGQQDVGTMERRLRCLERGRDQFSALTEVVAQGQAAAVQHAIDAVYTLERPSNCKTSDVLAIPVLPAQPELRARSLSVERSIAQATALETAAGHSEALRVVNEALPEARAIPYPRAEAELLLLAALAKNASDDKRASLDLNQSAFLAAERAADDTLAARAAGKSAQLFANWLDNVPEAERWVQISQAKADRAGPNSALQVNLLEARIYVNVKAGRAQDNFELHEQVIKLLESLYGEDDPRVGMAISNRSVSYYRLLRYEQAAADAKRALDIQIRVFGANDPSLAGTYANLGAMLTDLDRLEEAKDALRRGLELQAGLAPGPVTVNIYGNLGSVDLELGNVAEALESLDNGLRIAHELKRQWREWGLRLYRAEALGMKRDLQAKAQECEAVLAQTKTAASNPMTLQIRADALACLGAAELALGTARPALSHLEESLALQQPSGEQGIASKKVAFELARALRAQHKDPTRACELAQRARKDLQSRPRKEREVAEIDAFLSECAVARLDSDH